MKPFHSCLRKNKDGTNRITEKGKRCLWPTSFPYWKKIEDTPEGIRTRSQEHKQKLEKADFNSYCRRRGRENVKRWLETHDSEVYLMKESESFSVVCLRSPVF